jgi:hypothetical protein
MKWPWQKSDKPRPLGSKGNVDPGTTPRKRPAGGWAGGTINPSKPAVHLKPGGKKRKGRK